MHVMMIDLAEGVVPFVVLQLRQFSVYTRRLINKVISHKKQDRIHHLLTFLMLAVAFYTSSTGVFIN